MLIRVHFSWTHKMYSICTLRTAFKRSNPTFTVIAEDISEENKYVESITLNGEPYTKNYITHEDIVNGGTLVFKMKN